MIREALTLTPRDGRGIWSESRLRRATWGFVALGVVLRVARYLLDFPIWWDEAFVAVNFLRRDYLDLLRPLDYGQVCPLLFLWAELVAVKCLGFSEWSLRLFPLVCSIAGLLLFWRVAARVVRGLPLLLAVAIFAVAFHPIRNAAEVKPYAGDGLAALMLLGPALAWWMAPRRTGWLWGLAAIAPVALSLSHPAVFAAGGIGLGLAPAVGKERRAATWAAYLAFLGATVATFLALYLAMTSGQASATLAAMQAQWGQGFPPLDDPFGFVAWFVTVHTGGMFAYPCGGERGASGLTLLLFVVGAIALGRRGRGTVAAVCLGPFALGIVAAGLRRYPYGGVAHGSAARIMQYLAPGICLLAGLGLAALIVRVAGSRRRDVLAGVASIGLAAIGIVPVALDATHPQRTWHAARARRFAREFWPELCRGGEPVCLRWDLGLGAWDSTDLNVAVYLCNQAIYSPGRRRREPSREGVSGARPLRCVLSLSDPDDARVAACFPGYRETSRRILDMNMAEPGRRPRIERYVVYEFAPAAIEVSRAAGIIGTAQDADAQASSRRVGTAHHPNRQHGKGMVGGAHPARGPGRHDTFMSRIESSSNQHPRR